MRKPFIASLLVLLALTAPAFAREPVDLQPLYGSIVTNLEIIVQLEVDGKATRQEVHLLIDQALQTFRVIALTDEGLNGKHAKFNDTQLQCFIEATRRELQSEFIAPSEVLARVDRAIRRGKLPRCGENQGSDRPGK